MLVGICGLENLCDDLYLIDDGQIIMHEETDTLLSNYGVLKLSGYRD